MRVTNGQSTDFTLGSGVNGTGLHVDFDWSKFNDNPSDDLLKQRLKTQISDFTNNKDNANAVSNLAKQTSLIIMASDLNQIEDSDIRKTVADNLGREYAKSVLIELADGTLECVTGYGDIQPGDKIMKTMEAGSDQQQNAAPVNQDQNNSQLNAQTAKTNLGQQGQDCNGGCDNCGDKNQGNADKEPVAVATQG